MCCCYLNCPMSSKLKMAHKLLLLFACLSAAFHEHEAEVATPEQIAIAATGEWFRQLSILLTWLNTATDQFMIIVYCMWYYRHCWDSHCCDLGDIHSNQQLCSAVLVAWSWPLHKHNCYRLFKDLCGSGIREGGGAPHSSSQDCSHRSSSRIWYIHSNSNSLSFGIHFRI